MISTYGRVLSAIKKALWKLVEEYRGVGKSFQDLVEGQERNTAQLERIGDGVQKKRSGRRRAGMIQKGPRMALEKVRRRGLRCPPLVSIVVLFFL